MQVGRLEMVLLVVQARRMILLTESALTGNGTRPRSKKKEFVEVSSTKQDLLSTTISGDFDSHSSEVLFEYAVIPRAMWYVSTCICNQQDREANPKH